MCHEGTLNAQGASVLLILSMKLCLRLSHLTFDQFVDGLRQELDTQRDSLEGMTFIPENRLN